MPIHKKIFLFGYSGHAYVVIDTIQHKGKVIGGYFDKRECKFNPYKLVYCGDELQVDVPRIVKENYVFPSVGENKTRKKIIQFFSSNELSQTIIIHANSSISPQASVGLSTLVGDGSIINSMAKVGQGCIINTQSVIEHECSLADFVHIAPGVVLGGSVHIGTGSLIGMNSVIRPGQSVGSNVVVGAGSVVVNDIPDNEIWAGNPARKIRDYEK